MSIVEIIGEHGLSDEQVLESRAQNGWNEIQEAKGNKLVDFLVDLIKEPMIILLLVAAIIYAINDHVGDAIFLLLAIVLVASISIFQNHKTEKALSKLKSFSARKSKVLRSGSQILINSKNIVVGDLLIIEEGDKITADGNLIYTNDFSANESILTGESISIFKNTNIDKCDVYSGTTVNSGMGVVKVSKIGNATELGKIGISLSEIEKSATPLETQINGLVKKMIYIGGVAFIIVWLLNYLKSFEILNSLQLALTFAMSIIPEEIPVAFTSFMALGAWRLLQKGVLVKDMKTIESLGGATVLCLDKTGTITQNKMKLVSLFSISSQREFNFKNKPSSEELDIIETAMWASEPIPFDEMEKSLHKAYASYFENDRRQSFAMFHEYPLDGSPPMMTHIYQNKNGERIIAAKGAPEGIIESSNLNSGTKKLLLDKVNAMTKNGLRVLAVARSSQEFKQFPARQQDINFECLGLVGFYDPPKEDIAQLFSSFYKAGIKLKMITGDIAQTAISISKMCGLIPGKYQLSGAEVDAMPIEELKQKVNEVNIFYRMFPAAKLKVINALVANGEIVSMTGDGVNDGPALKASHIGIAMGKKGTDIAKEAASIVLSNDNLNLMLDALEAGRKIYANLRKAIQYIISIHIPIILTVLIPLILNWKFPNIFTPVHVIVLELIMGPTCSIIYENEPLEKHVMNSPPTKINDSLFSRSEFLTSIIQGVMITVGVLFVYNYAVFNGFNENYTRTMTFICLMSSNVFLTLVNRSFYLSIFETLRYKNKLVPFIIGLTLILNLIFLYVSPVRDFFDFTEIAFVHVLLSFGVGFCFVIWYEFIKYFKRSQNKNNLD